MWALSECGGYLSNTPHAIFFSPFFSSLLSSLLSFLLFSPFFSFLLQRLAFLTQREGCSLSHREKRAEGEIWTEVLLIPTLQCWPVDHWGSPIYLLSLNLNHCRNHGQVCSGQYSPARASVKTGLAQSGLFNRSIKNFQTKIWAGLKRVFVELKCNLALLYNKGTILEKVLWPKKFPKTEYFPQKRIISLSKRTCKLLPLLPPSCVERASGTVTLSWAKFNATKKIPILPPNRSGITFH